MQRAFQRGEMRIPADRTLHSDLHSVERQITLAGNLRYAAGRGQRGHADRFMALALGACRAAIGYWAASAARPGA
ncbi:MAG: hypothetical protein U1D55_19465 [Phycisphaerae bacterium]